jgi:hypothetical protein
MFPSDNAGPWRHDDESPCPYHYASKPFPSQGHESWCTEHQQHVHPEGF